VDLYWLHRDDPSVPVGDILGWLNEHLRVGLVRAIGCSNWSVARQAEADAWAAEHRATGFCASQIRWSLADYALTDGEVTDMLSMDDETFAWHRRTGRAVVAYSSQACGFFSGKYGPGADPAATGVRKDVIERYDTPANRRRLAAAEALAAERGCTANQVALACLFHQPFPVCALTGAHTLDQLRDSCAAADVRLSPADVARLTAASD